MASCVHLHNRLVHRCADIVNEKQRDGKLYGDIMQCAHCDLLGTLCDFRFAEHFLNQRHYICVRLGPPFELYCSHCGDFEYSNVFDRRVNRKRRRTASSFPTMPPPRLPTTSSSASSSAQHMSNGNSSNYVTSFAGEDVDENCSSSAAHGVSRVVMRHGYSTSSSPYVSYSSRGICNMGATCFMNSVLQVILHNPFLKARSEMQLTFSEPYNKGCSKARPVTCLPACSNTAMHGNGGAGSFSSNGAIMGGAQLDSELNRALPLAVGPSSSSAHFSSISDGCIACELRCLYAEAADDPANHAAALIPSNLLYAVWIFAEYMAGYDQQDAHEFLIALLDGLSQHLEKFHRPPAASTSNQGVMDLTGGTDHPSRNATATSSCSLVSDIFLGVLRSQLTCLKCGNSSSKSDPILDVSLSLESHTTSDQEPNTTNDCDASTAKKDPFGAISLHDCLRFFTSRERLSELVECEKCKVPCPVEKRLSFSTAPKTLVLHLKRFDSICQRKVRC